MKLFLVRRLGARGLLRFLPDRIYLKLIFKESMGYKLNLDNPKTFSEKIQWLKLNDKNKDYLIFVDKYAVRDHISKTIGEQYLVPLIGVYNNVTEIEWNRLPNSFVIKATHGSNSNIICPDRGNLDIKDAKKKLAKWQKKNWFWYGRAWAYKHIKPRILIEKYLESGKNTPDDYKVLCFNGKAKLIEVHKSRFENHTQDMYDINWNKTNINQFNMSDIVDEKPLVLDEMIRLSEVLSQGYPHLRIDWYVINNQLYFGEITLYDGSGLARFSSFDDDLMLGSWITI